MTDDKNAIMKKVQKLLRLGHNAAASENEAATALRQAAFLMEKHNLDQSDIIIEEIARGEGLEGVAASEGKWKSMWKKIPSWAGVLAVSVARYTETECNQTRMPNGFAAVKFFGYKSDVLVATWAYLFILDTMDAMAEDYRQKELVGMSLSDIKEMKTSYRYGVTENIKARVREIVEERERAREAAKGTSQSTALVVLAKKDAIAAQFGEFKYGKVRPRDVDPRAYRRGMVDGDRIRLSKVVKDTGTSAAKRLS